MSRFFLGRPIFAWVIGFSVSADRASPGNHYGYLPGRFGRND